MVRSLGLVNSLCDTTVNIVFLFLGRFKGCGSVTSGRARYIVLFIVVGERAFVRNMAEFHGVL